MADRPETSGRSGADAHQRPTNMRNGSPTMSETDAHVTSDEVLLDRPRADRNSALWLPPVIVLMLGTAFLGYRSVVSDWRGLSALFEAAPAAQPAEPARNGAGDEPKLAQADAPASAGTSDVTPEPLKDAPPEAQPALPPLATDGAKLADRSDAHSQDAQVAPSPDKPADPASVDPLDDIRREAEKTRERIAELEKIKKKEEEKLAQTEEQRRQEDHADRRQNIEKQLEAHRELFERQVAMMEEFQKRSMERFEQMQREFLAGRGLPEMPGFGRLPRGLGAMPPGFFDPPRITPPNRNRAPRLAPPPGQTLREGVKRLPDGTIGRFREFQGPNGMRGFVFQYNSEDQPPNDTPPPPEPDPDLNPRRRAPQID